MAKYDRAAPVFSDDAPQVGGNRIAKLSPRAAPAGSREKAHCSAHSTKANNGIPIVTTFSSIPGALTEQLIFEFASLSSWPMTVQISCAI